MYSDTFISPVKLSSQSNDPHKELISPEINETFSFSALGAELSIRKETLTPGPVYYPGDSYYRRTPGIDRPPQIRSLGAFEHSVNFERKDELLQNSSLIEESDFTDFDILCGDNSHVLNLSEPSITVPVLDDSLRFIHDLTQHSSMKDEYVSPGKNVHSQPFYPQHHYSITPQVSRGLSQGGSRSDMTERVPPLPRGSHYQSRLESELHPQQNYNLQSLVENRSFPGNLPLYFYSSSIPIGTDSILRVNDRTRQYPGRNPHQPPLEYSKQYPQSYRSRNYGSYYGNYLSDYQNRDEGYPNLKIDFSSVSGPQHQSGTVDAPRSSSPKSRNDLVESPVSKSIYKNFLKSFKTKESESFSDAIAYALNEFPSIPEKVRWRAYIDVADTLKRNSHYGDVMLNAISLLNNIRPGLTIKKFAKNIPT